MDNINIWYIPFNKSLQNDIHLLSLDEKDKAGRFFKDTDRNNYMQTHIALRKILSYYFSSIAPHTWKFKKNPYGKPFLSTPLDENIYFNLSHCSSCAYIIFSPFKYSGIDIEDTIESNLDTSLFNIALSNDEQKHLKNSSNPLKYFYITWTLKESYLKAIGSGLNMDLKDISFSDYIKISQDRYSFSTSTKNHYWVHCFSQTILSYAILNSHIEPSQPNFHNFNDFNL